jgi:TonB family protein
MPTSEFCIEQRQKQQQKFRKTLTLCFASSLLFHGVLALTFTDWQSQSPKSLQTKKPIEIMILQQSRGRSPGIASTTNLKPESKSVQTTSAPLSKEKPSSPKTPQNPAPQTVTPPPKVEQPQPPKVPPSEFSIPKSDSPPVLTATQAPVKSLKVFAQPKTNHDVKRLENPERSTKHRTNFPTDRHLKKPAIPPHDQPVKPEIFKRQTNSASILDPNSDRWRNRYRMHNLAQNPGESTQPESSKIATNSSSSSPSNSGNSSTARQSGAQNNTSTTQGNNSTATNTIPAQPETLLSISCEENCQPEYPSVLDGAEGSAGIRLTISEDGKVIDAAVAVSNGNPTLDREALEAAGRMEFSSIERDRAIVQINISFTVTGSDFERQARQEEEKRIK